MKLFPLYWLGVLLVALAPAGAQSAEPATPNELLDRDAFSALMQHDDKRLQAVRAKGGDPARYAKTDPLAIHNAAGEQGDLALLDFVLKAGADPNVLRFPGAPGGPLASANHDLAKMEMLVKAGADVNGVVMSGYTALTLTLFDYQREFKYPSNAKPGETQRIYSKLQVVRFLLDHGATINGGKDSRVYGGALRYTRPGDKEVIDLLISRGATLDKYASQSPLPEEDKTEHGPLATALQLGRGDLALALLRRDRVIAPEDKLALLEAARRGYEEVALALLAAGADAKATDDAGSTPLMWARKARNPRLVAALLKAGVPDSPALPATDFEKRDMRAFDKGVAQIIDDVAFMDAPRFTIFPPGPNAMPRFAVGTADPAKPEVITCERGSAFTILAHMNAIDSINVGVCKMDAKRIGDLARSTREPVEKFLKELFAQAPNAPRQLERMGMVWKESELPGGARGYEFPFIMIGHGILFAHTYVWVDAKGSRAVIVQAMIDHVCGMDLSRPVDEDSGKAQVGLRSPLCMEPSRAFAEIAERVGRLPE